MHREETHKRGALTGKTTAGNLLRQAAGSRQQMLLLLFLLLGGRASRWEATLELGLLARCARRILILLIKYHLICTYR